MKRVHDGRSLTVRSTATLTTTRKRAEGQRDVEVEVELRVDGERQRLRHALQAAGEHDRRAELAEPARERERGGRREPAGGEGERHAEERAPRARAECSRGVDEGGVESLERRDAEPDVERARDEDDREDHGGLREGDGDPRGVERLPEEAGAPERREERDAGHRRRKDERQLDQREHERRALGNAASR